MKKLLNTLYITSENACLKKDGENLVVEIDGAERARAPLHMLASVVTFGAIFMSPALIGACARAGISLVLLDRVGRFEARIEGPISGNVMLRRAQYVAADRPLNIVRSLVIGKVANQRAVLMRALRDYGAEYTANTCAGLEFATQRMVRIARQAEFGDETTETLRGLEGEAASLYFRHFDALIRAPEPEMRFNGRSRRPPLDAVNALLSFLYTLLTHECRSALESVGLDPAVGFLHRDRPGRPSLALDLMEEMRPVLADRLALSLINRRQVGPKDFETREGGAFMMRDEARRTVLTAWQERKRDERRHAFLDEVIPLGLVPWVQALLLARHLRGDLDAYPPWFWS